MPTFPGSEMFTPEITFFFDKRCSELLFSPLPFVKLGTSVVLSRTKNLNIFIVPISNQIS